MNGNGHILSKETSSPLQQYAKSISSAADTITAYCAANNLPQPSLDPDAPGVKIPATAPVDIHEARQVLIASTTLAQHVVREPAEYLPHLSIHYQVLSSLSWLHRFNIVPSIPPHDPISYTALATTCSVPESQLRSIIRMVMTSNFLTQPTPSTVAHNATSRLFATDPNFLGWLGFMSRHSIPSAFKMADATEQWGGVEEKRKNMTAWNLAMGTEMPFFEWFAETKERSNQFASYMRSVQASYETNLRHLIVGFNWASLGEATVVDVGGSTCSTSIALATAFPSLTFTVQDLPDTISQAKSILSTQPPHISSRITPYPHDFFTPQPITNARVYILRMILHDWPTASAIAILQNLLPALKADPGNARIVIMDTVLPAPGSSEVVEEALLRVRDLTMMQAFNSRERELGEFEELFASVRDGEGG
ncbi:MAG: hypothetical protein Q9225_005570, partial [Loekoesia sp. 1 TL-2023]